MSDQPEGTPSVRAGNKFSKYLFYAIGEIVLVVIGILIALQLNTWNAERIQKKELDATLSGILSEIESSKRKVDGVRNSIARIAQTKNKRNLELLAMRNKDSIELIYESISGISDVISVSLDLPATTEFLNDPNISEIKNERLKLLFLQIKQSLKFGEVVDNYGTTQLNTLIEPFILKHFNYALLAEGKDMKAINTELDHSSILNNLELENLINLKIETDNTKITYLTSMSKLLEQTIEEIENELKDSE
ncbi:hypothetical protein J1N09_04130 [Aureitalea sp. L0-47]|uniref:hypothetical protein n=1 Tax=Aureitalea sp. L0-47 TaxID=2816962 RepID=UPI0022377397|nr:hypothetical protein [Aureitalea sp. L0-47]MCW5519012.1 hypothetical protein [Aureitalea sp. L0-47]